MGDSQVVRHGPLEPVRGGSNPPPPAIFLLGSAESDSIAGILVLVPDKPLNYRNYSLGFKGLSALPGLIKILS